MSDQDISICIENDCEESKDKSYSQAAYGVSPAPAQAADLEKIAPTMHIVRGNPTDEEAAAVEALLVCMAAEWAETKHRQHLR